ncbi:Phosphopantetheine attachment site, partial [Seinonella peptonophila]
GEQTALAAYLVWANLDEAITLQELRADLLEQLPDYMIPVDWVVLDELPLTPNGKVDRRALPAPTRSDRVERQYIAPRTEDEQRLVQIWEEVLQLSPIGVTDHFFEMGGHSLTAIRLLARIRNEYQIEVPLQVIFTDSTIAGICRFLQQNQQEKEIEITAAPRQEVYPVTSAQKRLYVLHDFAGTAYHIPLVQWLYGSLDLARLEVALQTLVERHEALRTSFQFVEGQLVQQIHPRVTFQLKVHHLRHPEGVEKELQAAIRPFVLENAPLFRAAVYCFPKQKYLLLLDFHHLIADGQSVNLLWKEFVALYRGESLPELSLQYKDYAYWQMNRQAKEGFVEHEKYWSEKLSGEIPMLELPTDAPRPAVQQFTGNVYSWSLPIGLSQSLKQFAKQQGSTLYAVLLAGYVLLLMKETGQEELLVGSPQAGRSQLEMEQIVGMFVNTLPLRVHLQAEGSYLALLKEVSKQLWEDYQHRDYPIEELLAKMGLQHDQSRNPLFDTLFVLQNLEQSEDTLPGLAASPYEWESRTTKFDLTWTAVDAEQITFAIEYASHLFKEETIARMAAHYQQLLTQIVAAPDRSLHEYSCLTVDEEKQLLAYADGGQQIGSSHQTLVERWERQVEQTPQSIALVDQGRSMT